MGVMNSILEFFNQPFFIFIGGLTTLWSIFIFFKIFYLTVNGVLPVLYRLGLGLSDRKISIFADSSFGDLETMLIDSKVFKKKNIIII